MKLIIVAILCISSIWATVPINQNLKKVSNGSRIIGGQEAEAGAFPWQAAIYKDTADGKYFCGGALVSNKWVLTAAQCVHEAIQFTIHLGSNSLEETDTNRVTLSTSIYIIHESFDPTTLANDVGLIKFHMPITFTDYISSIRMATIGYGYSGRIMEAAGWGQVSDESAGLSPELNNVKMTFIENYECQIFYGSQLTTGMMCATGNFNEGTCFGDVGGPIIVPAKVGLGAMHVGITSFISQNGCESLDPSGFTRTSVYNDWVISTMNVNN